MRAERIRVTGTVQGVGFRPKVWRLARECGLTGDVSNDAEGVLINAWGSAAGLDDFVRRMRAELPPLAHIDKILRTPFERDAVAPVEFAIVASGGGEVLADVAADAATCPACLADVLDAANRRHGYAFTNCTHCGPRLSIVRAIPYDRDNTSMAAFPMCPPCQAEYADPADRRFHAQPNACADCGPTPWLESGDAERITGADAIRAAARALRRGAIVAVKGIGGVHLACDATRADAVETLRRRKRRYQKALALMARDLDVVRRYAAVSAEEAALLADKAAPIVVLDARGEPLPDAIAPGQATLGFMLPYTPLHHLLMRELDAPIVLTSGNLSHEPQSIDNDDARERLTDIADCYLLHDRDIVNRLDDSVLRVAAGAPRFLRRARGYAPEPIRLPEGFGDAGELLAMGGELKNTFCLLRDGKAIVSQHIGDMEDARTLRDYEHNLALYRDLFRHEPECIAVDMHPEYIATKRGRELAARAGLPTVDVQHHHAHVASCLAEHGIEPDAAPVLGVVLDGLGYGDDGTIWGGEFLLADYRGYRRLARFAPVPMPGGTRAILEPWRNTWAHLQVAFGFDGARERYGDLEIIRYLAEKPVANLEKMARKGLNTPPASSCGRLFDAAAAAIGVCRDGVAHEAQAAIELEALATRAPGEGEYDHALRDGDPLTLDWAPLWTALLDDLRGGVERERIAARFHNGVIAAVTATAVRLAGETGTSTVALSGGVFQNRLVLDGVSRMLTAAGLAALSPLRLPANDGGLSLGQAAVAATLEIAG